MPHRKTLLLAIVLLLPVHAAAMPLMWEARLKGSVTTNIAEADGVIYFGTSSGILYGINASTGSILINLTNTKGIYSHPVISGERIFFGCDNGMVYGVNRTTGERIWTSPTEARVRSSPRLNDNMLLVGSDDGTLYALKAGTGMPIWTYETGRPIQAAPLVEGWKIYFGSQDRSAYCVSNVTGGKIWNRSLRGYALASPALYRDLIIIGGSDRKLSALDKYTGEIVWNITLNGSLYSSPVIAGRDVIVADSLGFVKRIRAYRAKTVWETRLNGTIRLDPKLDGENLMVTAGETVYVLDAMTGDHIRNLSFSRAFRTAPLLLDGRVYAPESSYLRAYGAPANIAVGDLSIFPQRPMEGIPLMVHIPIRNDGDAIAADFTVKVFFDRVDVAEKEMSLRPGESRTFPINLTAAYGRHLVEVVADSSQKIVESHEVDNMAGATLLVSAQWPISQLNPKRRGSWDYEGTYGGLGRQHTWRCMPLRNGSLGNITLLWEYVNSTDAGDLSGFRVDASCYIYQSRGYVIDRTFSNWSCSPKNVTGMPEKDFIAMREYLASFNETVYTRSVRHKTKVYPFNRTDFTIFFGCEATPNPSLPTIEASLKWDCILDNDTRPTPGNLTRGWSCKARYTANHSLESLTELHGYPDLSPKRHFNGSRPLSDFQLRWSNHGDAKITASPKIADIDRAPDGFLETFYGDSNGKVSALTVDGKRLWEIILGAPVTTVSAHDLDRDGALEIAATTEDGISLIDHEGKLLWSFTIPRGSVSEPMSLNIDEHPEHDLILGGNDKKVYAIDIHGDLIWSYEATGEMVSPVSVWDLDTDGSPEVVIGSASNVAYAFYTPPYKVWTFQTGGDINGAPTPVPYYATREDLLIASGDGNVHAVYKTSAGTEDYVRVCGQAGCERKGVAKTKLRERWSYEGENPINTGLAVGDMDGDGYMEMAMGTLDDAIIILNATGARLVRYTTDGPIYSDPSLADLDGDGISEVLVGSDDGRVYIINLSGVSPWNFETGGRVRGNPAISDIDDDGQLEFVIGSHDGAVYMFDRGIPWREGMIWDVPTTTTMTTSTTSSTSSTTSSTLTEPPDEPAEPPEEENPPIEPPAEAEMPPVEVLTGPKPFPSNNLELGAHILLMSIMGYYFFLVMHGPIRFRRSSRLEDL